MLLSGVLQAQPAPEPLVVILDVSAAMGQHLGAARSALRQAAAEFPGNVPLGVIVFGHRSGGCGDLQVLEDAQSATRSRAERLGPRLDALNARGKCLPSRALLEALRLLRSKPGRLLLIAAGRDDCGGDPCTVAETLRQSAARIRADVVALNGPASALACVSRSLGGRFTAAADAETARRAILTAALGWLPGGRLRVEVTESGRPKPAEPYVTVSQSGRTVAQLSDNPSIFQLPAGEYQVSARLGPYSESARVTVRVAAGQTASQALNIATGTLVVKVTRPQGKPLSPLGAVDLMRNDRVVASTRAAPARFESAAGSYDVRVTLSSRQQFLVHGLAVEPARTVERVVEVPAGLVRVSVTGARYTGGLRPFVEVVEEKNSRFVASYPDSPADFQLLPGGYVARVRDSRGIAASKGFRVNAGAEMSVTLNVP